MLPSIMTALSSQAVNLRIVFCNLILLSSRFLMPCHAYHLEFIKMIVYLPSIYVNPLASRFFVFSLFLQ